MIHLMNSAMMPRPGYYYSAPATREQVAKLFKSATLAGQVWRSYIGYDQNARILSDLLGVEVPVSRDETHLQDLDIMIVMKLKYRLDDPAVKGRRMPPDAFEFFIGTYASNNDGPSGLPRAVFLLRQFLL